MSVGVMLVKGFIAAKSGLNINYRLQVSFYTE
jgi:hypothetical protein